MSTVAKAARAALNKDVTPIKTAAQTATTPSFKPADFLTIQYEAFPEPLTNCATLFPTREIAADPSHPFYPRIKNRAQNFDPGKLNWRIQCKVDVSNSAYIRGWAARRLKNAFARKLKENGLDAHGQAIETHPREQPGAEALSGALNVLMTKHDLTLTATKAQINESAEWLLNSIQERRQRALRKQHKQSRRSLPPSAAERNHESPVPQRQQSPDAFSRPLNHLSQNSAEKPEAIRKQVEYYFCNENLSRDRYLSALTGGPKNQPVSLRTLCSFNRMKQLSQSQIAVLQALRESSVLEVVDMDGTASVGRRVPLAASRWTDDFQGQGDQK